MQAEDYSNIFKALGHPIRLLITCGLLREGRCNVNTMSKNLNRPQSVISQHVNILKTSGLIKGYRKGNIIWYRLENELTIKLLKNIDLSICDK